MRFTRTTYPDFPGAQGSPCWQLKGTWVDIDADWNTQFPYGTSFGFHIGRQPPPLVHVPGCDGIIEMTREGLSGCTCDYKPNTTPGFLLDLNPPIGEPNRLYLWAGRWHITLGLPSVRDSRDTGEAPGTAVIFGREVPLHHIEHFNNWLHPHLDGIDRYRYHQDQDGRWVRNDRPEPMHWGWLTIGKRREA